MSEVAEQVDDWTQTVIKAAEPLLSSKGGGYNQRAKVEVSIGRYKRVIDDVLRSRTDQTEATKVPSRPLP
jgi:hypothetical protein